MKRYEQVPGPKSLEIWNDLHENLSTGMSSLAYRLPIVFNKGENDILHDVDGNSYIDWDGGTLTQSTGHCNKNVIDSLKKQLDNLWNIHDYPTREKLEVVNALKKHLPADYVFQFYNGGSETVESALKAAISFQSYKKRQVLSFQEGYHGKTRGSLMAVHALYGRRIQPEYLCPISIPFPKCLHCPYDKKYGQCDLTCATETVKVIENNKGIGIFIFEPILGTGGIYGPPQEYWDLVKPVCKERGILLIADEISTGVYRTGEFLAVNHYGVEPDLIAFGKGVASGFPAMILAGKKELMRDPKIAEHLENPPKTFGLDFKAPGGSSTTFGGSPLAICAIKATLEEFERVDIAQHVLKISTIFKEGFKEMQKRAECIVDVRTYGLLIGVEIKIAADDDKANISFVNKLYSECAHYGLFIKPDSRGIIHITPPLTMTEENALKSLNIFEKVLLKLLEL